MGEVAPDRYRASKLPAERRGDLGENPVVRMTIEEGDRAQPSPDEPLRAMKEGKRGKAEASPADAVALIRPLRDEWNT